MKRLVIALFLLLFTAGVCLKGRLELDSSVEKLLKKLDEIEAYCKAEDFDRAAELAGRFPAEFEESTRLLPLFLPHSALESAQTSAELLPVLARSDRGDLYGEVRRCRSQLIRIREGERIGWRNIF